ncbi:TetR/AcrR family transcriptional regulator [Aeromicrobium sp. HA]|uniref:TetR/AcrR family transcriptional regulator n=1 Tax=unclassified Aeromicrobium TaxID=2633570 RepID=UPI0022AEFA76|nr:helix-turn-helix domain-containing protein [Aeromicrobium sp. HA]
MDEPLTPAQDRTRRTILRAAVRVLSANRSAGIREVAEEADVARSTVHRYFPDRPALESAIDAFVEAEYADVAAGARLDEGSGLDALLRFGSELFDGLDVFGWWFLLHHDEPDDEPLLLGVARRGISDGSIDGEQPAWWVADTLWSLLHSSHLALQTREVSRGEVRALLMHSLRRAVAASD